MKQLRNLYNYIKKCLSDSNIRQIQTYRVIFWGTVIGSVILIMYSWKRNNFDLLMQATLPLVALAFTTVQIKLRLEKHIDDKKRHDEQKRVDFSRKLSTLLFEHSYIEYPENRLHTLMKTSNILREEASIIFHNHPKIIEGLTKIQSHYYSLNKAHINAQNNYDTDDIVLQGSNNDITRVYQEVLQELRKKII